MLCPVLQGAEEEDEADQADEADTNAADAAEAAQATRGEEACSTNNADEDAAKSAKPVIAFLLASHTVAAGGPTDVATGADKGETLEPSVAASSSSSASTENLAARKKGVAKGYGGYGGAKFFSLVEQLRKDAAEARLRSWARPWSYCQERSAARRDRKQKPLHFSSVRQKRKCRKLRRSEP
ncbi:unnamed protein product, partial [Polarella glacialis]